jgi:hypothetical protein
MSNNRWIENIPEEAVKELQNISLLLESDPELIDSMSSDELRNEICEIGLDFHKPLMLFPSSKIVFMDSNLPSRLGRVIEAARGVHESKARPRVVSIQSKKFLGEYQHSYETLPEGLVFFAGVILTFLVPALLFCYVVGQSLPFYLMICDHVLGSLLGVLMFRRSSGSCASFVPKNFAPEAPQVRLRRAS